MTKHLTGRSVLVWLIGFFGVIIAMNAYFITVSTRTFRGEDEQKPYLQGVEYNQTLVRHARQAALGWTAAITATRLANGDVRIEIQLRDRQGHPLTDPGLSGQLRHPADENRDRMLHLSLAAPGLYRARLAHISPGAWGVLLHSGGDRPFDAERRIWVR